MIDIGVNLTHHRFESDLADVVQRARDAGVAQMIVTGTGVTGSREAVELAHRFGLYATVGVHPHNARECNDTTLPALREMLGDARAVAVGECGLDFDRNFSPPQVQEQWFEAQVALACELRMPLFLHERAAFDSFMRIMSRYSPTRSVVHCFTGTARELEAGYYIGITGWICDPRRGKLLQELVRRIPLDRLMLETDAPFLPPRDLTRLKRNEPAWLPHIARKVAACLDIAESDLVAATTRTAAGFFLRDQHRNIG